MYSYEIDHNTLFRNYSDLIHQQKQEIHQLQQNIYLLHSNIILLQEKLRLIEESDEKITSKFELEKSCVFHLDITSPIISPTWYKLDRLKSSNIIHHYNIESQPVLNEFQYQHQKEKENWKKQVDSKNTTIAELQRALEKNKTKIENIIKNEQLKEVKMNKLINCNIKDDSKHNPKQRIAFASSKNEFIQMLEQMTEDQFRECYNGPGKSQDDLKFMLVQLMAIDESSLQTISKITHLYEQDHTRMRMQIIYLIAYIIKWTIFQQQAKNVDHNHIYTDINNNLDTNIETNSTNINIDTSPDTLFNIFSKSFQDLENWSMERIKFKIHQIQNESELCLEKDQFMLLLRKQNRIIETRCDSMYQGLKKEVQILSKQQKQQQILLIDLMRKYLKSDPKYEKQIEVIYQKIKRENYCFQ